MSTINRQSVMQAILRGDMRRTWVASMRKLFKGCVIRHTQDSSHDMSAVLNGVTVATYNGYLDMSRIIANPKTISFKI